MGKKLQLSLAVGLACGAFTAAFTLNLPVGYTLAASFGVGFLAFVLILFTGGTGGKGGKS